MLSRIAESLFWIGRYIERSDGTARILDVHLQLLLEDPWIDEDSACRSLLSVMGSADVDKPTLTRRDVLGILAVDRHLAGSLETEADGAAPDLDDVDLDVVADADGLADAEGESEHVYPSVGVVWPSLAGGRVMAQWVGG